MNKIKTTRIARVTQLMREKKLAGILICNCAMGNLDTWLLAKVDMPLHLPYNRNNLCLIDTNGTIRELCSREPHPTDWGKYPLITDTPLSGDFAYQRLGIVNAPYLKRCVRDYLRSTVPGIELVDVGTEFHKLVIEKISQEVQGIQHAAQQFETAFRTLPLLLTGQPLERQVAVALRNRLRELGAECEDLSSSAMLTLTSAPDGALSIPEPIPYPGRRIDYGDRVNILLNGFMPGGFASALGRSYVLGDPSAEAKAYWNLAVAAQDLVAKSAKPGVTVAELMELVTHEILEPNDLPAYSGNQIFGIGAGICEMPRNIDTSRTIPLHENMTIVIAIRITPPGKDAYCCMDPFVITADGAKRLTTLPRELVVLD